MNMESVKGYNFMELDSATSSFSDLSQIGRGGYGKVYKGHLPGGLIVAVKRAEKGSLQGQKEFYTEIELLSRLHHRNLVSLLGYCDQKGEQVIPNLSFLFFVKNLKLVFNCYVLCRCWYMSSCPTVLFKTHFLVRSLVFCIYICVKVLLENFVI